MCLFRYDLHFFIFASFVKLPDVNRDNQDIIGFEIVCSIKKFSVAYKCTLFDSVSVWYNFNRKIDSKKKFQLLAKLLYLF